MSIDNSDPKATEYTVAGLYTTRLEFDINNNPIYIGRAAISSLTSAAVWQIRKIDFDVSNNPLSIKWADGDDNYDNVWDNRAALTYT